MRIILSRLRVRLRALLRREAVERELDEEVRYHLHRLIAENLAAGMSEDAARAAALRSFAGVEQAKEECRDARGTRLLDDLAHDLRYAARGLRRSPGFTATVVLCLAVGIGANITIFSLYNGVLLRSMPVDNPGQLVRFADGYSAGTGMDEKPQAGRVDWYSYLLYQRLRDRLTGSAQLLGLAGQQSGSTTSLVRRRGAGGDGGFDDDAVGRCASGDFFQVLGVAPHLGRLFGQQDETAPGANPVVVLSHRYWQRRFGGDPTLVGGSLVINGTLYTVVGVAAPGFDGTRVGDVTDFWVPLTMQAAFMQFEPMLASRAWSWLHLIGRLSPGASLVTAETAANVTLQQFLAEGSAADEALRRSIRIGLELAPEGMASVNQHTRHLLAVLMAGVGLLLLIVCLNVSHLMVARAIGRHHEMTIRAALGAGRGRLVRQLLTEGILLDMLGVGAGVLLARWSRRGLVALLDDGTQFGVDLSADVRVWWFTAGLGVFIALVLGLMPAWRVARADPRGLRVSGPTVAGGRRLLGRVLLTSQVAFSLVLLVATGLLTASLLALRAADTGFDTARVLLVDLNPRMAGLRGPQRDLVLDDLLARVEALPGVERASMASTTVLTPGYARDNIQLPGRERLRSVQTESVTPGYFDTLGMKILRGRAFTTEDRARSRGVVVVNETLARRLFGRTDVLGRRFRFEHYPGPDRPDDLEIVGVVQDARTISVRRDIIPIGYMPAAQRHGVGTLQVKAAPGVDPSALAGSVRRAVREAHAGLPIVRVRTMQVQFERTFAAERTLAVLAGVFGLAALLLVCIGLYGVVAQWAAQRTREIGVRMAMGATAVGVQGMVLRHAFSHVLAGLVLGLPAAVTAGGLMRGLLFGVEPTGPPAFVGAVLLMIVVAAVAAYLPARRASLIDPMLALRCE